MNLRCLRLISGAFLFLLASVTACANSPAVSVTDLSTLGGAVSWGFGVNNLGQVAGTSQMPGDKVAHGFFYSNGKMTDLGTLGGDGSQACAVNDAGQVTGTTDIKEASNKEASNKATNKHHAFLWQQGHMGDLDASSEDSSDGLAINSAGQVAGSIVRAGSTSARACLWTNGKVDVLDNSDRGSSESDAINSSGQVTGTTRKPGRDFADLRAYGNYFSDHAVLWQEHKTSELRASGAEISLANTINNAGQVAGAVSVGRAMLLHACLWQNGTMTDLGTLAGQDTVVYSINHAGIMVGGTNPHDLIQENGKEFGGTDKSQVAFYCFGTKIVDLNDLIDPASGWVLAEARSISDTGYVTGTGLHDGQFHAFLLKLPVLKLP